MTQELKDPKAEKQTANFIDYLVLGAASAETYTIPDGATHLRMTNLGFPGSTAIGSNVYVARAGTATVPAADIDDGSGEIGIYPGGERLFPVTGLATLSVISNGACNVMVEVFGGYVAA